MSLIYPRLANLRRRPPALGAGAGAGQYDGLQRSDETVIATDLPCNIQIDRTGRPPVTGVPGDPIGSPTYKFFFAGATVPAQDFILERDILEDELPRRYMVIAVEWQVIGTQVRAQLLEN